MTRAAAAPLDSGADPVSKRALFDRHAGAYGSPPQRLWFAQAMRGAACLCVVFYHLGIMYISDQWDTTRYAALPTVRAVAQPFWLSPFMWLEARHFDLGKFGVSLFFLISGFVIPFSLQRGSAWAFGTRRFLRIYPVYWFALFCTLGVLLLESSASHVGLPFHSIAVPFNALLVQIYAGQPSIDSVNWTLAIEDMFYVIVALLSLIGLIARPRAIAALAGLIAIFAFAVGSQEPHSTARVIVWGLAFNATSVEFILLGLCFYHTFTGDWSRRTSLLTGVWIGALWWLCIETGPFSPFGADLRVSGAVAFAVFALAYRYRELIPRYAAVNWLANISYPLYVMHAILGYVLLNRLTAWTGQFYLSFAITLAIVLGAAFLVHTFLERPSIALGRRVGRRLDESIGGASHGPRRAPGPASVYIN